MADVRKTVTCEYCDGKAHIKYADELELAFCPFCGESTAELQDEEDDGDLDYTDLDREELTEI